MSSFITTLGHAARPRRPDADHLPRPAGRDAGRRGDLAHREGHAHRQRADIVLPEKVNEVGTFAKIFGAGTYSELIWALVIVIGVQVLLTLTRWGTYTIAVGGNKLGARGGGHQRPPDRDPQLHRVQRLRRPRGHASRRPARASVTPDTAGASESMFRAVSAAVIGGTLLAGGVGTAIGALFGALFLGVLRDGLTLRASTPTTSTSSSASRSSSRWSSTSTSAACGRRSGCLRPLEPERRGHDVLRSRTSPSASARSRRCATSTCTWARARCSGCSATTAPASRR